jgi:hypothetical protein
MGVVIDYIINSASQSAPDRRQTMTTEIKAYYPEIVEQLLAAGHMMSGDHIVICDIDEHAGAPGYSMVYLFEDDAFWSADMSAEMLEDSAMSVLCCL